VEELYISYNEIEDLFDFGFLEKVEVLDLEGNNISSLDQLNSLRRCPNLRHLNLLHNPLENDVAFYKRIQECCPNLKSLNDEPIGRPDFFEEKTASIKNENLKKSIK